MWTCTEIAEIVQNEMEVTPWEEMFIRIVCVAMR